MPVHLLFKKNLNNTVFSLILICGNVSIVRKPTTSVLSNSFPLSLKISAFIYASKLSHAFQKLLALCEGKCQSSGLEQENE